jgi:hypothetical protein
LDVAQNREKALRHLAFWHARRRGRHVDRGNERFSTRRGTGKWVRWSFIVERSRRLGRPLAACLSCLPISPERALYVNPHDELMLVAEVAEA